MLLRPNVIARGRNRKVAITLSRLERLSLSFHFFCLATSKCQAIFTARLSELIAGISFLSLRRCLNRRSLNVVAAICSVSRGYKCICLLRIYIYIYVVCTCMVHSVKSTFRAARRCSAMLHAILLRSCALHLSTFPALHPRVIQVRRLITGLLRH